MRRAESTAASSPPLPRTSPHTATYHPYGPPCRPPSSRSVGACCGDRRGVGRKKKKKSVPPPCPAAEQKRIIRQQKKKKNKKRPKAPCVCLACIGASQPSAMRDLLPCFCFFFWAYVAIVQVVRPWPCLYFLALWGGWSSLSLQKQKKKKDGHTHEHTKARKGARTGRVECVDRGGGSGRRALGRQRTLRRTRCHWRAPWATRAAGRRARRSCTRRKRPSRTGPW